MGEERGRLGGAEAEEGRKGAWEAVLSMALRGCDVVVTKPFRGGLGTRGSERFGAGARRGNGVIRLEWVQRENNARLI